MRLQIIGAGYGRTGTRSLKLALEQLGFDPCHHVQTLIDNPIQARRWLAFTRGAPPDWSYLFENHRAAVDYPSAIYYQELMTEFPDAKVILTERDADSWYDSTFDTIFQLGGHGVPWYIRLIPPLATLVEIPHRMIWQGVFNGRFEDRDYAISLYQQHNEAVKQTVPPNQLLIYSVKEGWEPLCRFLNVPVPETPFPRTNERNKMKVRIQRAQRGSQLVPVILGLTLAWWVWRNWGAKTVEKT